LLQWAMMKRVARKNHRGVGPRRAGAAELAAVDALDSDGRFALYLASVWRGIVCPNYLVTFVASSLTIGFDAFIVDLMSQSRDLAPMGDDEAAKGAGGRCELEFRAWTRRTYENVGLPQPDKTALQLLPASDQGVVR